MGRNIPNEKWESFQPCLMTGIRIRDRAEFSWQLQVTTRQVPSRRRTHYKTLLHFHCQFSIPYVFFVASQIYDLRELGFEVWSTRLDATLRASAFQNKKSRHLATLFPSCRSSSAKSLKPQAAANSILRTHTDPEKVVRTASLWGVCVVPLQEVTWFYILDPFPVGFVPVYLPSSDPGSYHQKLRGCCFCF